MRSRVIVKSYSFQIDLSYICGLAETMRKRYVRTRFFFENGEKRLRFQTNTETCVRGLK